MLFYSLYHYYVDTIQFDEDDNEEINLDDHDLDAASISFDDPDHPNGPEEISLQEDNEAHELEDNEIAKALKALENSSYIEDDEQFSNLLKGAETWRKQQEESSSSMLISDHETLDSSHSQPPTKITALVVPGDRRDFFSLTVQGDKTPLATQKWGNQVHVVAPLASVKSASTSDISSARKVSSTSAPAASNFRARVNSGTFRSRDITFTRTEDGELAIDLTSGLKSKKNASGWEPPKKIISVQIHTKKTPESQFNLCAGCQATLRFGLFSSIYLLF